jgi:hypothetical protein
MTIKITGTLSDKCEMFGRVLWQHSTPIDIGFVLPDGEHVFPLPMGLDIFASVSGDEVTAALQLEGINLLSWKTTVGLAYPINVEADAGNEFVGEVTIS